MKKVFIAIVVVIVLLGGCMAMLGGSDDSKDAKNQVANTNSESGVVENEDGQDSGIEEDPEIEYTVCTVDEMMDLLNDNALNASKTYKDQYVEVTGKLKTIDSSGDYISLAPENDDWAITGVTCYIKSDEQLDKVSTASTGDSLTVKGKIKDVGEILGYSLDIDEIL